MKTSPGDTVRTMIEIGEFTFDPATGELSRLERPGQSDAAIVLENNSLKRLAPQPAQLLKLLIDAFPNVVSRESIQQELWPGIKSDFDSNLHFCIRQIRTAFNESASSPKYIETIPRRGYRLIAETNIRSVHSNKKVEQEHSVSGSTVQTNVDSPCTTDRILSNEKENEAAEEPTLVIDGPNAASPGPDATLRGGMIAIGLILLLAMGWLGSRIVLSKQSSDDSAWKDAQEKPRVRVAIMPFQSELPEFSVLGNGEIALDLLERLHTEFDRLDVLGPTTTETFSRSDQSLKQMVEANDIDLIVNGRFLTGEDNGQMLAEIIRGDSGRHVWVQRFDSQTSNDEIAEMVLIQLYSQVNEFTDSENVP